MSDCVLGDCVQKMVGVKETKREDERGYLRALALEERPTFITLCVSVCQSECTAPDLHLSYFLPHQKKHENQGDEV